MKFQVKQAGAKSVNGCQWYIVAHPENGGKELYLHKDYIPRKQAIQTDRSGHVYYTGWYRTRQEARNVLNVYKLGKLAETG